MFNNIEIESYRGLKNIKLDNLDRVNVIIGENNSGKTSVLEAIQLFEEEDVIYNLSSIAYKRQVMNRAALRVTLTKYEMLYYSLPMNESEPMISIRGQGHFGEYDVGVRAKKQYIDIDRLEFRRSEEQYIPYYVEDNGTVPILVGEYYYNSNGHHDIREGFEVPVIGSLRGEEEKYIDRGIKVVVKTRYISPRDIYSGTFEVAYYKGILMNEKQELIELLKLFDPTIVNVEASLEGQSKKIMIEDETGSVRPLSVYGEGMRRAFSIANALRTIGEGVLLIDEFEVGIHKNALSKFVDFLCYMAKKNRTQLFLTTHSGDAIDALIDAHEAGNGFNVYRLESYDHNIYSRKYDGRDLYKMRSEQGYGLL
ncbi:AAA family ATPase [Butyrivibrio sp. WCD2001]|uniref:AAA family ATPase n=1 Tax=Butyrivibrio sp. WCD2001 TaxID=1280681 RepID=UPI0004160F0E|nr:ATP-binding protein [Butyrivibrio sp. WCD2001]